jgi:DNA-binding Lrp family transcriptional regulator
MEHTPNNLRPTSVIVALDAVDRRIVAALQNNARISNKDLARVVGLAPSTCLARLKRLRAAGVFRGFHADVDPAQLGRPIQAIVAVRLAVHDRQLIDDFHDHVLALPETISVFHVGGGDDYLVHVAVPDTGALRDLVLDGFTARAGVAHVETRLIFEHTRKLANAPAGSRAGAK